MINVITEFFNTILGVTLPTEVCTILAFSLVSCLCGGFFSIFGLKTERVWKFATYVCIVIMAIMAIANVTNLSLAFGGA